MTKYQSVNDKWVFFRYKESMPNTLTRLIRFFDSRKVGEDGLGNQYYIRRSKDPWGRIKRFVVYGDKDDASLIPPMYHAWLHYRIDEFPDRPAVPMGRRGDAAHPFYERKPTPNLSGTRRAYKPHRAKATGDYESWSPKK